MAADFKEGICPPQWVWDRLNELTAHERGPWGPSDWDVRRPIVTPFASHIWRTEEPPVDPAMDAVWEAIATYENRAGFLLRAGDVRRGILDNAVSAALREAGVLK